LKGLLGLVSASLLLGSSLSHAASVGVVSGYYQPYAQYVAVEPRHVQRAYATEVVYVVETQPIKTYTLKEYEVVGYVDRCDRCDMSRAVYYVPIQCR
jgi:protein-disulfide isomerase